MKHLKEDAFLGRCKTHGLFYFKRSEMQTTDISFFTIFYGVCPKCNMQLSLNINVSSVLTLREEGYFKPESGGPRDEDHQ